MRQYGYITGDFDIHTSDDVVWEFERINEKGEFEIFSGLETARDMTSENVVILGSNRDFIEWFRRHGIYEEDEN